ncbi:MAG: STT3 domain-containing protein [bacterium]|nr:STT3 domain-containing protein [bacterium]
MGEEILEERKNKILAYFKGNPFVFVYVILALIAAFGFYIRTRSLNLLIDVTTGDYMPSDPDAIGILRYVRYVVENGQLMAVDTMRYFPSGFSGSEEFALLSHLLAWFYKIFHFFDPSVTVAYADVIYPAFAFVIGLVFFFLFVRKVFDWKVALLASAILTVLPAYLFRTLAGVSDKEALAMIFFYAGLYFFIAFFTEKKLWRGVLYSILAGISVGAVWSIWGGIVFILTTIGSFILILLLIGKLDERHLWFYALFLAVTIGFLTIFFPLRATPVGLLTAPISGILFLALALGIVHYYLYTKDRFHLKKYFTKVPVLPIFVSLFLILFVTFLILLLNYGISFFTDRIANLYIDLIEPFGKNRWALTVAESHQPYFVDWIGQFSWRYLAIVFAGAVLLFYETFKSLGKHVYSLTVAFVLVLLAISLNRYSSSSIILNGETNLSILFYLGTIALFFIYCIYLFYHIYTKKHEQYEHFLTQLPYGYLFMCIFFVFLLIGARSAVRLLFVFAPGTAILAAFFVFILVKYTMKISTKHLRYGLWLILGIFVVILLNGFSQAVLAQAESAGSGYNQQWQYAMDWVRENTPEDAVFAHWWDYGYYVQTGGERATLSDGGNAHPTINYLTGRYLLTGQNDTDALQVLGSRNATHVLVVSDEIGKYGAFSAIGADADYDRYSWITAYTFDSTQSSQTNETITLVYTGGSVLDDPITYQGTYFPAYAAAMVGFIIPMHVDENANFKSFESPQAVIFYNGNYYNMPLRCVFFNGEEYIFGDENFEGLDACFQIIPTYQNNQFNGLGAGLYLSHEVWNTWFTEHYLFGQDSEYFTTVYSDESSVPLAIYNGRIIGPHKIFEVHYPENLTIGDEFYISELPEGVNTVREDLQ